MEAFRIIRRLKTISYPESLRLLLKPCSAKRLLAVNTHQFCRFKSSRSEESQQTTQTLNCARKQVIVQSEKPVPTSVMDGSSVSEIRKKKRERKQSIDNLGTWDSSSADIQLDASIASGKLIPNLSLQNIGVSRTKGRRTYNEDQYGMEHLIIGNPPQSFLYLAVFDGHGGPACSKFCAQTFPGHVSYWLEQDAEPSAALHDAFLEVNNSFARWFTYNKRENELISSGSTATICLIQNSMDLILGHVGDSRIILCRSGEARKLTTDHNPSLITEKTRIEQSGGKCGTTRVNDRLAMTRSIGDLDLKRYGVIAEPDVRTMRIDHSRDAFLVLTTDGINSVMTDHEIVETVKQAEEPQSAASLLTDTAFQYSSEDNNTAMVIALGSWGKYSAQATIFHSFGKSFTFSSRFG